MSDRRVVDELCEYARRYRTGEKYQQLPKPRNPGLRRGDETGNRLRPT